MGRFRAAIAVLCLLTACPRQLPLRFGPEGEVHDPHVLLRALEHRSSLLHSLTASGRITVHSPRGGGTTGVDVAAGEPGSLRIEVDSFFGNPVGLLASDGHRVQILDVDHGVFSEGAATAANVNRLLPLELPPEDVVRLLLADPRRLDLVRGVRVDPTRRAYALTLMGGEVVFQTLYLDTETLALVGETASGHEVWFKDLAQIGGVAFPREIDLSVPGEKVSVELHYKDLQLNPALDPTLFAIQPPQGAKRVPLD